jgi:hypothetical protein
VQAAPNDPKWAQIIKEFDDAEQDLTYMTQNSRPPRPAGKTCDEARAAVENAKARNASKFRIRILEHEARPICEAEEYQRQWERAVEQSEADAHPVEYEQQKQARKMRYAQDLFVVSLGYFSGLGPLLPRDDARALPMLQQAAALGHTGANAALGFVYETGRGVAADPAQAAELYKKAADAGHNGATNNLANLYIKGAGVRFDRAEARRLYERAAQRGSWTAQANLRQYLAKFGPK